MSGIKEVLIDLSSFESLQKCRQFVDSLDRDKHFLVLQDSDFFSDTANELYLLLIDGWMKEFPGRVFIKSLSDAATLTPQQALVLNRIPRYVQNVCWSGNLFYSENGSTRISLFAPAKPDRVPFTETIHVLSVLTDDQLKSLPVNSLRPIRCYVDDILDFHNALVISPSADQSDCKLYVISEHASNNSEASTGSQYWLHAVQSPSVFSSVYKCSVQRAMRECRIEKSSSLRGLAVGRAVLEQSVGSAELHTIMTKKQSNAMTTASLISERIFPFFSRAKAPSLKSVDSATGNFENTVVNRKINKSAHQMSQSDINAIFKELREEADTVQDLAYTGKRHRRLLGTSFNSHKYVAPSAISRESTVDGPMLSEVIGEALSMRRELDSVIRS